MKNHYHIFSAAIPSLSRSIATVVFFLSLLILHVLTVSAGTVSFSFALNGNGCVISNTGDGAAYYPAVFQLDSSGKWIPVKLPQQLAELPPGGFLSVKLENKISNKPYKHDISTLMPLLVRYFDQAGLPNGKILVLRSTFDHTLQLNSIYGKKYFFIKPPDDSQKIFATWVLVPPEGSIENVMGRQTFKHNQPDATRIVWGTKSPVRMDNGAGMPPVILLHETQNGLNVQESPSGTVPGPRKFAWLKMKNIFFIFSAVLCLLGFIATIYLFITADNRIKP